MQNKEAALGAVLGAGGGAAIGALAGGKKGAIIGAGVGALSGGLIGHYVATQERTRTQTTASVGYRPEQGNLLTITEATAAPTVVKQGEPVKVSLKYTILRPDEEKANVKETHEVRYNGTILGTQTADRFLEQGEQRITWEYPVQPNAQAGSYQIITTATVEEKQTASIVTFNVQ
ncbi:MAG: hypothetical protein CV089_01730 [Nitrospira sp. WS110]|nr:hypothetical protein [Nitrospira sp. WS110]